MRPTESVDTLDALFGAHHFRLHCGHIPRISRDETELHICGGHDEQLLEEHKLAAPAKG